MPLFDVGMRSLGMIKRERLMNLRFNLALFDHRNEIHEVQRAIGIDGESHLVGAQRVQEGGHDLLQSEIQRPETPVLRNQRQGRPRSQCADRVEDNIGVI